MRKDNPAILTEFLNYLFAINYSITTIKGYEGDLLIFFNFIIKYLNLKISTKEINVFILMNVKRSDIIAFTVFLNYNRENIWSTRKRKLASIKMFYNYLYMEYPSLKKTENPMARSFSIMSVNRLPKYIQLNDAKRLQHIFNITNTRKPLRNNTILVLFLNTGMRLSELTNIKIRDINLQNKTINVIGKGNVERIIYLNEISLKYLSEYLNTLKNKEREVYLFTNKNGNRLCNATIENICLKAYKLAGIASNGYTTHTLRHTAATYIYKQTKDVLVVKEILGHQRLDTTMIYTHLENEDLKKAVNNNPLNNFKY